MKVSIDDIKRLKSLTGVGLTDAKKALEEADGDFDKALEAMRKKGLTKAEKRGEREARARPVVANLVAVGLFRRGGIVSVHSRWRRSVRRRPRHSVALAHHHDPPLAVPARPVHHHRCRPHRGERPHRPVRRRRRRHERLRPARRGRSGFVARCERQRGIGDGADAEARRHRRLGVAPRRRLGDLHRRQQRQFAGNARNRLDTAATRRAVGRQRGDRG